MFRQLSNFVKTLKAADNTATGTTDVTGDAIDTAGFEGVRFIVQLGTANAGNGIRAEQAIDSAFTTPVELLGSAVLGKKVCILDIFKPTMRYTRVIVERGGATTTLDAAIAELYNPRTQPAVSVSANVGQELHVSPVAGTA